MLIHSRSIKTTNQRNTASTLTSSRSRPPPQQSAQQHQWSIIPISRPTSCAARFYSKTGSLIRPKYHAPLPCDITPPQKYTHSSHIELLLCLPRQSYYGGIYHTPPHHPYLSFNSTSSFLRLNTWLPHQPTPSLESPCERRQQILHHITRLNLHESSPFNRHLTQRPLTS